MVRVMKIIFVLLLLVLLAVGGISFWVFRSMNAPHEHAKANEFVKIEKGTSPKEIIARLTDEGILTNYAATLIYLRVLGDSSKLQAGEYQFDSPNTKITIPEGFTRFDIAKRIAEKFPQNPPADDKAILAQMDDVTLIRDI